MLLNVLIKVPEDLSITDPTWQLANPEVAWELSEVLYTYTKGKTPGTQVDSPTKLIQCAITLTAADPVTYLDALLSTYGLHDKDWSIVHVQSAHKIVPEVWDNTDPENPVLVSPAMSQAFRTALDADMFPYLVQRHTYDIDGNVTGDIPKHRNQLFNKVGYGDWL